jgi:hypothetical protein
VSDARTVFNPYPGLRPFEPDENHLFFGRDGQSNELLRRLRRNRFLAVVGTSGSGKSSLVRAGLLPDLQSGMMAGTSSHWRIALFRPGGDPIGNLAAALCRPGVLLPEEGATDDLSMEIAFTTVTLQRSALGIVEAYRQAGLPRRANLLIVVDQFEELFRFKEAAPVESAADQAAAFVKLLLAAPKQPDLPVYVIITMRSDFLGDCAQFRDLPEAMNDGQYLVPRMTRSERREAITGPAAVGGAQMTPRLVQRLLNDVGDNPDQLPILQHALMRTWDYWQIHHSDNQPIDLPEYQAIGEMENALSIHADEAFAELAEEQPGGGGQRRQQIAEKLFRFLTEKGRDNREIRRPAKLADIVAAVEAGEQDVVSVIDVFRKPGRSFLMPPADENLSADTLIDISHESLIRNWQKLKAWVDEEARSADTYRRLAETAVLYQRNEAGFLTNPALQIALNWQREQRPNAEWASRYGPNLESALGFLEKSVKRQRTNKLLIASLLVCIYSCVYSWLVIATTDDVSLATNSSTLPFLGTEMPTHLVYLVSPLVMISLYAWFLYHLRDLVLLLSSQPKTSRMEGMGMHALAWVTVPATFIGLWVRYLPRRDWFVTDFHIAFLALSVFMAVLLHRSSAPRERGPVLAKQRVDRPVILCVLLAVMALWGLSFGAFNGIHERRWTLDRDVRALVPWIFYELGYDVFFDFQEQVVPQLPDGYWLIESETDRLNSIKGVQLKKADLRYVDMYQASFVNANLRNSDLRSARLREGDFRRADFRDANLVHGDLRQGDFRRADFRKTALGNVNFGDADLRDAQLGFADLKKADFNDAKLTGADLRCADLRDVKNLPVEVLKEVKTLYRAQMNDDVRKELEAIKGDLFTKPADTWYDMTTRYTEGKKDICE